MPAFKDLTNQKFGMLTVISRAENKSQGHTRWLCQCECGNTSIVYGDNLKRGTTTSCGCQWNTGRKPKEIIAGTRFGHLTVIKSLGTRILKYGIDEMTRRQYFLCKCDCGKTKEISYSDLMAGVKTCGCGKRGRGAL